MRRNEKEYDGMKTSVNDSPVEVLVETRASKLTKLEFGPRKLSGVFRVRAEIVSGDRVVFKREPFPKSDPS